MVRTTSPFRRAVPRHVAQLSPRFWPLPAAVSNAQDSGSTASAAPAATTALTPPAFPRPSGSRTRSPSPRDAEYPPCEYYSVRLEPHHDRNSSRICGTPWGASSASHVNAVSISFDGPDPGRAERPLPAGRGMHLRQRRPGGTGVVRRTSSTPRTSVITLKANARHITSNPLSVCGLTVALQEGTDIAPVVRQRADATLRQERPPGGPCAAVQVRKRHLARRLLRPGPISW